MLIFVAHIFIFERVLMNSLNFCRSKFDLNYAAMYLVYVTQRLSYFEVLLMSLFSQMIDLILQCLVYPLTS